LARILSLARGFLSGKEQQGGEDLERADFRGEERKGTNLKNGPAQRAKKRRAPSLQGKFQSGERGKGRFGDSKGGRGREAPQE